jgi:hypothetical protein
MGILPSRHEDFAYAVYKEEKSISQKHFKEITLEQYVTSLQDLLDKYAGDENFTYMNFKINNPQRLSERTCRKMLEGIDHITALFKKKGMSHLLRDGVETVILQPVHEDKDSIAGLYYSERKEIEIFVTALSSGRLLSEFVNEIFLHEFAHYLHLDLLDKTAKKYWDSTWDPVHEKKREQSDLFQYITADERSHFFDLLMKNDWNPTKVAAWLDPIPKLKFGIWLRNPLIGDPLITPSQFRLTRQGQYIKGFYNDIEKWMQDNVAKEEDWDRRDRRFRDKLGLLNDQKHPIPSEDVKKFRKDNPALDTAISEELAKLEPVSGYAGTNEMEDFAETFVAFMAAPQKLTPTSKARMMRTLSLSGLYGKPVMQLSHQLRRLATSISASLK